MGEKFNTKRFNTVYSTTIRNLLKKANEEKIHKEDVISIVKEGEQFVLIYFK